MVNGWHQLRAGSKKADSFGENFEETFNRNLEDYFGTKLEEGIWGILFCLGIKGWRDKSNNRIFAGSCGDFTEMEPPTELNNEDCIFCLLKTH